MWYISAPNFTCLADPFIISIKPKAKYRLHASVMLSFIKNMTLKYFSKIHHTKFIHPDVATTSEFTCPPCRFYSAIPVDTVARPREGWQKNWGSIPGISKKCSTSPQRLIVFRSPTCSLSTSIGSSLPGDKVAEEWSCSLTSISAEILCGDLPPLPHTS
jgi:hypothetical protein